MLIAVLGIVALIAIIFVIGYNKIVSLEQRVKRAFHDIDVQVKRVAELIPNLVNTVKGSARFEKEVLTRISEAYKEYLKGAGTFEERVEKARQFLSVVYPIVLQLPNYPELQSVQGFRDLMNELRVSMDKIAYARQFYNQAVEEYNKTILKIPWNLIAAIMGKREMPYFEYERREEVERRLEEGELTRELEEI